MKVCCESKTSLKQPVLRALFATKVAAEISLTWVFSLDPVCSVGHSNPEASEHECT